MPGNLIKEWLSALGYPLPASHSSNWCQLYTPPWNISQLGWPELTHFEDWGQLFSQEGGIPHWEPPLEQWRLKTSFFEPIWHRANILLHIPEIPVIQWAVLANYRKEGTSFWPCCFSPIGKFSQFCQVYPMASASFLDNGLVPSPCASGNLARGRSTWDPFPAFMGETEFNASKHSWVKFSFIRHSLSLSRILKTALICQPTAS